MCTFFMTCSGNSGRRIGPEASVPAGPAARSVASGDRAAVLSSIISMSEGDDIRIRGSKRCDESVVDGSVCGSRPNQGETMKPSPSKLFI